MCLVCHLKPFIGCKACGWRLCEKCRRTVGMVVNRQIHWAMSPACKEGRDEHTNPTDWPSFYCTDSKWVEWL